MLPCEEPKWLPESRLFQLKPPLPMREKLLNNGSLTRYILDRCSGKFSVQVQQQTFTTATQGEQQLLQIRHNTRISLRTVHLYCGETPWVFARTVIPVPALQGRLKQLTKLGTKPLGAVLYSEPNLIRHQPQYTKIFPCEMHFAEAISAFNGKSEMELETEPEFLWGRRVVYEIEHSPILVNEIFLSDWQ